ncbi:hypothetical protein WJN01_04875 [Flavobacteriaceae bacterium SZ-1-7]|uniref:hypothetical protein n=1 Tax=Tamlana sedimenti TaxID=3134126 RepID=UPI003125564B
MKLPIIKGSYLLNVPLIIVSIYISWLTLLFGIAHLVGGKNPDITFAQHLMGVAFCIVLCVIGIVFLIVALAAIRGIIQKLKGKG